MSDILGGGSRPSAPPAPPPPPTAEDPAIQEARARAYSESRKRRGRAATILGGAKDLSIGNAGVGTATTLGGDRS